MALVTAATPSRPEETLFDAMLVGWRNQQAARRLSLSTIEAGERVVRRFAAFSRGWPWSWREDQIEGWVAANAWAHSTVRTYQGSVGGFLTYVCDPRYGWAAECERRVGALPRQICHDDNRGVHVADYEGRPDRRPLSRKELQLLFDTADDAVGRVSRSGRKGWLTAFRDATMLKTIYAWGLRLTETAMLDLVDFTPNPAAPVLGRLGTCHVRFGKAQRGSPPKRRSVSTVMPWAAEALEQYLIEVRPCYGRPEHPAVWLTERGGRISPRSIEDRFGLYRARAGLPAELTVHCLRHSYVSHLIEDGVDPLFVQHQVGHSWASTTAIYTSVGADAKNRMLHHALARAFDSEEHGSW